LIKLRKDFIGKLGIYRGVNYTQSGNNSLEEDSMRNVGSSPEKVSTKYYDKCKWVI